jgi:septation ring formation regulator EzrA
MPLDPTVLTDLKSLLQQAYDELNEDIWETDDTTIAAAVNGLADSINDAMTALNQLEIAQNDAALQVIQGQVAAINKQLKDAQAKITVLVKDFAYIAVAAGLIDKAIEAAAKLVK